MDTWIIRLHKTRMIRSAPKATHFVENLHTLPDPRWDGAVARVPRAGHAVCGPDYAVTRASSPGFDLLYCIAGRGVVHSGGAQRGIGPGTVVAIAGNGPHSHAADPADPWTLLWLRVTGADACISALFGTGGGTVAVMRGAGLVAWFERLFSAMRTRGPNQDLALHQLVAELWPILNAERLSLPDRRLPAPLERLTAAMSVRPAAPWSASDMQETARISPAQLRRQFRTHLQSTPREWLRRERIMLAQDLLLRPGARVAAVAEACGFADIYHFSREFRRTVGQSPTAWRQMEGPVVSGGAGAPEVSFRRSDLAG